MEMVRTPEQVRRLLASLGSNGQSAEINLRVPGTFFPDKDHQCSAGTVVQFGQVLTGGGEIVIRDQSVVIVPDELTYRCIRALAKGQCICEFAEDRSEARLMQDILGDGASTYIELLALEDLPPQLLGAPLCFAPHPQGTVLALGEAQFSATTMGAATLASLWVELTPEMFEAVTAPSPV